MITRHFQLELLKLFARKRTYLGFLAFLGVEIVLLWLLRLPGVQRSFARIIEQNGYAADYYLSGLTLGLFILLWTIFLLGALFLALVSGDLVAKEVEDGTMRMMLCRPVSRARIILVKFGASVLYTFSLVFFIGLTALLTGWIQAGSGGLFVIAPAEGVFALHDGPEGLRLYLLSLPLLAFSLLSISTLGLLFSCCRMKPAAATILTLTFFFVDSILRNIPYLEEISGYFLTARMGFWVRIFAYQPPWEQMLVDVIWLGAINISLVLAAITVFAHRPMKS
jgi:ABC-2 type transport system permease protein